jgi:hypothetical protein
LLEQLPESCAVYIRIDEATLVFPDVEFVVIPSIQHFHHVILARL